MDYDADVCHCCHLLILFIQDGTFGCEKKACPAVTCLNPAAGECCPECNNCQLDGRLYQNGQRFPDPTDLCQQCACEVSVAVNCSRQIFLFHIPLSSVQYGMHALRKAHMCSTPSLRGSPVMALSHPFKEDCQTLCLSMVVSSRHCAVFLFLFLKHS